MHGVTTGGMVAILGVVVKVVGAVVVRAVGEVFKTIGAVVREASGEVMVHAVRRWTVVLLASQSRQTLCG